MRFSERTMLFVPGDRPERFAKAASSGADAVLLDLEDAVPEGNKAQAREASVAWLAHSPGLVRVNAVSTPWHADDLAALAALPEATALRGVVLPKSSTAPQVATVIERLPHRMPVLALVENAIGLREAAAIAGLPQVARMLFGSIDYALDTGITPSEPDEPELLWARSALVNASRAAGLPPRWTGSSPIWMTWKPWNPHRDEAGPWDSAAGCVSIRVRSPPCTVHGSPVTTRSGGLDVWCGQGVTATARRYAWTDRWSICRSCGEPGTYCPWPAHEKPPVTAGPRGAWPPSSGRTPGGRGRGAGAHHEGGLHRHPARSVRRAVDLVEQQGDAVSSHHIEVLAHGGQGRLYPDSAVQSPYSTPGTGAPESARVLRQDSARRRAANESRGPATCQTVRWPRPSRWASTLWAPWAWSKSTWG